MRFVLASFAASFVALTALGSCTTIDPGANYVVPDEVFNANYYYCFVEPNLILGKKCGDNGTGGCHYSDKVPAMQLTPDTAVPCTNGAPTDPTTVAQGTPANSNYSAVSIEMSPDYLTAPIYIWPTQIVSAHPIQVFTPSDPVVQYIATWAEQE